MFMFLTSVPCMFSLRCRSSWAKSNTGISVEYAIFGTCVGVMTVERDRGKAS